MLEPQSIEPAECRALLGSSVVGRVAITTPEGPHVVPVNYSVVEDRVVFRTSRDSLVGTYGAHALMAFEVDRFDHEYWSGWSVVVRGRAERVSVGADIERINRAWPPRPWASGDRNVYFALTCAEISGRRLGVAARRRDLPVRRGVAEP